jgi:hypothetical protein
MVKEKQQPVLLDHLILQNKTKMTVPQQVQYQNQPPPQPQQQAQAQISTQPQQAQAQVPQQQVPQQNQATRVQHQQHMAPQGLNGGWQSESDLDARRKMIAKM